MKRPLLGWRLSLLLSDCGDKIWMALAWRLPRPLVYWCFLRLWAHGTTGRWGNTNPGKLSFEDASNRWWAK